jgi:hypothetical protein
MRNISRISASVALALAVACGVAQAEDRHAARGAPGAGHPSHWQFDGRFHHDHYYPARGYVTGALPGGSVSVAFGGHPYYFRSGVWFRPVGARFVVVAPPFGIAVPFLPGAYASLWIGGAPYYYANGVYYAPAPVGGYTVVAPPPGADTAQVQPPAPPAKAPPDPIIYPRNGQTAAQTEADRQECNRWATTQPSPMADASVFQRAIAACMDGRGYTVR